MLLGRLGACQLTIVAVDCEGEGCALPTWVYSVSPVGSAMAGNWVLLDMLACLLTVVAVAYEGAQRPPGLQAPLGELPCDRPNISMGVHSYNRNVTFREAAKGRPLVTEA